MTWRVAVVGSRSIVTLDDINAALGALICVYRDQLIIVSGGAGGVDTLAEAWAWEHNVPCEVIKPDYQTHGSRAPLERNKEIADRCDGMIALWDGESTGTMHAVACARKRGKPVEVFTKHRAEELLDPMCVCGDPAAELHPCPYAVEIHNNDKDLCNCCEECSGKCYDDI